MLSANRWSAWGQSVKTFSTIFEVFFVFSFTFPLLCFFGAQFSRLAETRLLFVPFFFLYPSLFSPSTLDLLSSLHFLCFFSVSFLLSLLLRPHFLLSSFFPLPLYRTASDLQKKTLISALPDLLGRVRQWDTLFTLFSGIRELLFSSNLMHFNCKKFLNLEQNTTQSYSCGFKG